MIVIDDTSEETLRKIINDVARTGNATVRFEVDGRSRSPGRCRTWKSPHVTIDGNGATLDGSDLQQDVALDRHPHQRRHRPQPPAAERLRQPPPEGPGGVRRRGDHVSSTGSTRRRHLGRLRRARRDGAVRVPRRQHALVLLQVRVGTAEISLHHSWLQKAWIRSPLISGAVRADVRNVIIEDWTEWGARFENGASGNVVTSLFTLSPYARRIGGKPASALRLSSRARSTRRKRRARRGAADRARLGERGQAPAGAHRLRSTRWRKPSAPAPAACRATRSTTPTSCSTGWHVGESEPLRDPPPEKSPPVIGGRRVPGADPARLIASRRDARRSRPPSRACPRCRRDPRVT